MKFHQHSTYAVTGFTVLKTLITLNILHHFAFVIEQNNNDFTASKAAETDECNQKITRMRDQQCCNNEKENKADRGM